MGMLCYRQYKFPVAYKVFKDGRETNKDNHRPGLPSTSKANESAVKLRSMLARGDPLTFRINWIHRIETTDQSMPKINAKLVPENVSAEQKENRFFISEQLLNCLITELNSMHRVITADE
ncbi:hypothetical protein Trydic_g23828 [Trypoxylus dichotomus]